MTSSSSGVPMANGHCLHKPVEILHAIQESVQEWIIQKASVHDVVRTLVENCRKTNLEFHGQTPADGNCFFHAVCDQMELLDLPAQSVADLRNNVVTFMMNNPVLQGPDGITEFTSLYPDWNGYCKNMATDGAWADHVVIVATAHMLQRDIVIVTSSPQSQAHTLCRIRCGVDQFKGEPLWLGHVWEWHYQSLKPMSCKKPIDIQEEENFVRLHLALQMICSKSVPCIASVLTNWHSHQKLVNMPCMNPQQCIKRGRPKPKKSCTTCITWRNAIESVYHPVSNVDRIPWQNIDPTRLHHDAVEAVKAFTFRLPADKSHTSCGDFDAGSLLKIMYHFKEFHGGDSLVFNAVRKVEDIRNSLSHTNVNENLKFNQKKTKEHFEDLDKLVQCLQNLYPAHFTRAVMQDLNDQLQRLQRLPLASIGNNMIMAESIQNLYDDIKTNQLVTLQENTILKLQLEELMKRLAMPEPEELDVSQCRKELKHHYLQALCKIPLIPGDKSNYINMDDIYTDVSILLHLPNLSKPLMIPLQSHHEIFTRTIKNGMPSFRLLVLGNPGCGKSILTLKLAYDWAVKNPDSPLKDLPLLFVLNMRWMTFETTLEDAIFQQLLPKDTKIERNSLRHHIETNQSSCIVIFDSYDEYGFSGYFSKAESRVYDILLNESLRECQILVTSRFWKASDFEVVRDVYTQIEISGFSDTNVEEYVFKFFSDDKECAEKLLKYMVDNNLNPGLANVPLMTLLFCMCWRDSGGEHMPCKISDLYDAIFKLLHKQYLTKNATKAIDLHNLVLQAGRVALSGLWSTDDMHDRVTFTVPEFVDKSSKETVIEGCEMGLLSIEQRSTGSFMALLNDAHQDIPQSSSEQYWIDPSTSITYFHKSCQERCAGEYLAHISQTDQGNFNSRMKLLNTAKTCMRLELVLRFACGASKKVAVAILQHLLQVFRTEFAANIQEFYHETLHPNSTKQIQDFIELCLLCCYEGSLHSNVNLEELFPHGQMLFFGMSPYTSSAIGQYISTHSIESIAIKAIPTPGNINNIRGVLSSAFEMIRIHLKKLPDRTLRKMCEHQLIDEGKISFEKLCNVEFCKYFKDWQSSRLLSLAQMFESKASLISLKSIKLVGVKIGHQMEQLQAFIEQGSLLELTLLDLHNSGLSNDQVNDLLSSIKDKLPNLEWLDISRNLPVRMHNLGDKIVDTQINVLLVHSNAARVEDMSNLITNIPRFGSRMRVLYIHGNAIDDESGRILAKVIPSLHRLEQFSFIVYRMKDSTHNKVIKALCHLPLLTILSITGSWVIDDLILNLSKAMISFPNLNSMGLYSSAVINQNTYFPDPLPKWTRHKKNQTTYVKRSAAKAFIANLNFLGNLAELGLGKIPLHKEDMKSLLDHIQVHGCRLKYARSDFHEDINPLDYDCLDLHHAIP